jgi:phosphoribosylformylglycinamidine synthase
VLPVERLVLGSASGVGNLAVLLGSRTGRDGIGGVSVLASAGFSDGEAAKRPSVQVGDPYEEKRLIEACLALLEEGLVVGIQDLGGAGLACATSETAARAGLGMDVDVSAVIRRESAMSPIEVMTSESQERMLAIVTPEGLPRVIDLCARWEVEAAVIGVVRPADADGVGRLRILDGPDGKVLAEVSAASLADDAPRYSRPLAARVRTDRDPDALAAPDDPGADLLSLLTDASWIYRQYDHQLFCNTIFGPGEADATLLRLAGPGISFTNKALALSADANPGWCRIDPREGTRRTVAESALNVSCAGARPVALVNCLNFGNPTHPEVMWELSESIDGMAEACRALLLPVVGGNVSLYNESNGADIEPTPVVAVVGLVDPLLRRPPAIGWRAGDSIVVLGDPPSGLAGSSWARACREARGGRLTPIDLEAHGRLCGFVSGLVAREAGDESAPGLVHGVHDVGEGGLGVALAEMCIAAGIGAVCDGPADHRGLFAESPSRVLVATDRPEELLSLAASADVAAGLLGRAGGARLSCGDILDLAVEEIVEAFASRIPRAVDEAPSR